MSRKQRTETATADTAPQTDAAQAAIDSTPDSVPTEMETQVQDAIEIEISAVAQQQLTIASLQAAIDSMPAGSAARLAIEDVLVEARGTLAMLEAQAESEAAQAQETSDAIAAAAAFNLSDATLNAMLAAIDQKYAPAPIEAEPTAEPQALGGTRKPLNPATVERNLTVGAALASDSALAIRVRETIEAFNSADLAHCTVRREAGTRFASVVAFASVSDGVANRADYVTLATAIRMTLAHAPYNLRVGGQSTASVPWLSSTGPHAAGAVKGNDSLRLSFADRREIALYADGRFRLAQAGTLNVRFIRTDASAYAQFVGGAASAAPTPAPATPHVPTPPTVQQMQAAGVPATEVSRISLPNGGVTSAARCQHCSKRNLLTDAECSNCGAADWRIA
jgi:hypothetical protein